MDPRESSRTAGAGDPDVVERAGIEVDRPDDDGSELPWAAVGVVTPPSADKISREVVFDIRGLDVHYGKAPAVRTSPCRSTATRSRR